MEPKSDRTVKRAYWHSSGAFVVANSDADADSILVLQINSVYFQLYLDIWQLALVHCIGLN